ncbi:MAG: hypothetical protein JJE40_08010 [Vicinamibacteria bacterium]|nr:hypothetical protein [Vicinamibacteria bacterium]
MRLQLAGLFVVLLSAVGVPAAQEPLTGPPRLRYSLVYNYPGDVYGPFHDALTEGGCSPLYFTSPREGCALIRDEPAWIDFSVYWTGASPLRLAPQGTGFVSLIPKRTPGRVAAWPMTVRWRRGEGQQRDPDGTFRLTAQRGLGFRIDLARMTATSPVGPYLLCFRPNLAPPAGVLWFAGDVDACYRFELFDNDTLAARLELLRRRAVDLLADFKCSQAAPVIERMLDLHPRSAAAYRLRGVIAELEGREEDAVADYVEASHLLRAGDTVLPLTAEQRASYADSLDDWRVGLQMASGLSLIRADGEGPTCR